MPGPTLMPNRSTLFVLDVVEPQSTTVPDVDEGHLTQAAAEAADAPTGTAAGSGAVSVDPLAMLSAPDATPVRSVTNVRPAGLAREYAERPSVEVPERYIATSVGPRSEAGGVQPAAVDTHVAPAAHGAQTAKPAAPIGPQL